MCGLKRPGGPFLRELSKFIKVAVEHAARKGTTEIYCPCDECKNNVLWNDAETVRAHLVEFGFMEKYTTWSKHGKSNDDTNACHAVDVEVFSAGTTSHTSRFDVDEATTRADTGASDFGADVDDDFDVEEMLRHVKPQVLLTGATKGLDNFETLQKASKDLLYEESKGCAKQFTVLRTVLELMKLKAVHGWSDASFTDLLQLLSDVLPKPNNLPKSTYFATAAAEEH